MPRRSGPDPSVYLGMTILHCSYRTRAKPDTSQMKPHRSRADDNRMAVHVICPSLRCRKILTLGDEVRGTNVSCRYCQMQFRVPQIRRAAETPRPTATTHTAKQH